MIAYCHQIAPDSYSAQRRPWVISTARFKAINGTCPRRRIHTVQDLSSHTGVCSSNKARG